MKCRVCNAEIKEFMTFGKMPIANGFLLQDQFDNEYFFELAPAFCEECFTFQLIEQPDANKMFHENYAFFSSLSKYMQIHFKKFAESVIDKYLSDKNDPFVVELGSNDGIFLQNFKNVGIKHLGIEPSENVADVARSKDINTISEFFNYELAEKLVEEYGKADALMCANVMCHIPDINSVAKGIAYLLKSDGVLIFEDPYLGDMINKTSYDQIYDEHVYIFSASSVASAFGRHNLELIDVIPQITHGGSMRYVLAPKGSHPVSSDVDKLFQQEIALGLRNPETYDIFKRNCEKSKKELLFLLNELKNKGKRVVGYGATSKSTTVMNYCNIKPEHIEFISDTTPIKQGKFTPGAHIPVKSYDEFSSSFPDYALLLAWNHSAEIFEKEQDFKKQGGKWITFVPEIKVIE